MPDNHVAVSRSTAARPEHIADPCTLRIRCATYALALLAITFSAFFQLSKQIREIAAVNPFAVDPYDAVGSIGFQIALLVALLGLVRVWRPYDSPAIPLSQVRLLMRGNAIALLSVAVSLFADVLALLKGTAMWDVSPWGRALVSTIARALSPRSHPWRFGIVISASAGAALSVGHYIFEGPPPGIGLDRILFVSAFFFGVEAVAVFVGYVLFGRFLGMYGLERP